MIPKFPNFKKLELSDRDDIENMTSGFPPYSDFNFVSMWSWNIDNEMVISELNNNLVVKFNDYITAEPFYSFLGHNKVDNTVSALLEYSRKGRMKAQLQLIPEETVELLDINKYKIEEQVEHFDYIISIERLMPHEGIERKLSSRRKLIKKFKENSNFEIKYLDLDSIKEDIGKVFIRWELQLENGVDNIEHLRRALNRLLNMENKKNIKAYGAYLDGSLIGYSINEICLNNFLMGHFQQGDTSVFPGIYALLMHETAPFFNEMGIKFVNLEQDLGIPGLRKWKQSHMPINYLKKYKVSRVENRFVYNAIRRIIRI